MKKILFTLLSIGFLIYSCAPDKKAELEKLRQEQKELSVKIEQLLQELDSSSSGADTLNKKSTVVDVLQIEEKAFVHYIGVQGKIDSDNNVMLSAKTPGTITSVFVNEGDQVSKGQVLAQIDDDIIRSNKAELQSSLDLATTLFERQKNLWEQNIGTEIQYLQAKNNKESLERRMASLNEQLQLTKIIAPFSGIVDEVIIKKGEVAAPGMPAIRIINPSDYKIVAEVAESYINKIKKGNKVKIDLPILKRTVESRITNVSKIIDPTNRTFKIEVELADSLNKYVKSNMIVFIHIEDYRKNEAIVIPVNAVQFSNEEEDYVFIAQNNRAIKKTVKTGNTYNNNVEILDGLEAGEKIVVAGHRNLVDNQSISYTEKN